MIRIGNGLPPVSRLCLQVAGTFADNNINVLCFHSMGL